MTPGIAAGEHPTEPMSQLVPPTYDQVLQQVADAEHAAGWLLACEDDCRYLALNEQFVAELARCLAALDDGPVVEVCAGAGELAAALRRYGVDVLGTDVDPPAGSAIVRADATQALLRYQPRIVLGSFVPFDAGVDRAVLAESCVAHYVVLNARLGGQFGDACLWEAAQWSATPLEAATRWMICRHDVWLGANRPLLRHGEAWHFQRKRAS